MSADTYTVVDGRITSPGKFEGAPSYAPELWGEVMNDSAENTIELDDGTEILVLEVLDEDRRHYPALKGVRFLYFHEDSMGFVHSFTQDPRRPISTEG